MKKEDIIYYSILFASGAAIALWLRGEYNKAKTASKVAVPTRAVAFGVRG